MTNSKAITKVDIRPGVSILSILRHLNYQPWFALAEFVDNSIQSYLHNWSELKKVEGDAFKLKVKILVSTEDNGFITVVDNAAGINESDYVRAFRPAEIPLDQSGLCEFGMGMKSAACWFAKNWIVRTKALGEVNERKIEFDITHIVQDKIEELNVTSNISNENYHFTEINLINLYKVPQSRTIEKIKDHLSSIYRKFIRDGILELHFQNNGNNEILQYLEPKVLFVPYYKNLAGEKIEWRKNISFDFGLGLRVTGFAALRETASVSRAGFALFRRGRLIQGSADEGYRPEYIFKKSNSYTYQRLFGELHLEGFEVSHTKDGFRWEENEESFLELLREELNTEPIPLLDQAEGYRAKVRPEEIKKEAEKAVKNTVEVVQKEVPPILEKQIDSAPEFLNPPPNLPPSLVTYSSQERLLKLNNLDWLIKIQLTNDPTITDWVSISDKDKDLDMKLGSTIRTLGLSLSLAHPFTERFGGTEASQIEPLLRLAVAIGLAEVTARDSGIRMAGTFRRNINELLRDALSKP